jgi:hypothetical protein
MSSVAPSSAPKPEPKANGLDKAQRDKVGELT